MWCLELVTSLDAAKYPEIEQLHLNLYQVMKNTFKRSSLFLLLLTLTLGCEYAEDTPSPVTSDAGQMTVKLAGPVSYVIEDGKFPTVAIDEASQKTYVAFFRKDGEFTNVFLISKALSDTVWSAPVRVSRADENASAHSQAPAQVVVGPEGNVYVVWTNSILVEGRRFPASNLLFARSEDGGATFSDQRAINTDADGPPAGHTFHDITVSKGGDIYVSWLDSRERYAALAYQTSKIPVVKAGLGMVRDHAAKHEPGTQVWIAYSHDKGETFSEGTVVARETCQCCRTSIMVWEDDTVYVSWRHIFPGTERDMALARSEDGGKTFSGPERIHQDNWSIEGCPHAGPSLVIDAAGQFHAAWYTGEESKPGLYYSFSKDGNAFTDAQPLVTGVGVSQVQLAGHGNGRTWLTWEDKTTDVVQIAYKEKDGALNVLDPMLKSVTAPAIDASASTWVVVAQGKAGMQIMQGTY